MYKVHVTSCHLGNKSTLVRFRKRVVLIMVHCDLTNIMWLCLQISRQWSVVCLTRVSTLNTAENIGVQSDHPAHSNMKKGPDQTRMWRLGSQDSNTHHISLLLSTIIYTTWEKSNLTKYMTRSYQASSNDAPISKTITRRDLLFLKYVKYIDLCKKQTLVGLETDNFFGLKVRV